MPDPGMPVLSGLPPALRYTAASFHSHRITFSDGMTLSLYFCFPLRKGLILGLIAPINILIEGPFKTWE